MKKQLKKFASWNVNGLRAVAGKNFFDWLINERPDIFFLQETKAHPEQLPPELQKRDDYHIWYASAEKKGYSGVALFSNKLMEIPKVEIGIGIPKFDCEGRTIIAEYSNFIIFGCYFPNGQPDLGRVPYKLEYSKNVAALAKKKQLETKKPIIICGDYNTAHTEIDLRHPKANEGNTGFLPIERAWIDEFIAQGFVDIFRKQHPEEKDHYTWWSYRQFARKKNVGWRIDYFFVTEDLVNQVERAWNGTETEGSDHCPIYLEISNL